MQREKVRITIYEEVNSPIQSWKLTNARPKKCTVEGFKPDGNISIDTLVLEHEGIMPA